MSVWSTILILVTTIFVLVFWIKSNKTFEHIEITFLGVAATLLLILYYTFPFFRVDTSRLHDISAWISISLVAVSLTLLANVLRKLKPSYAKYPVLFSFLPLIIVIAYPFIRNSDVIQSLLLQLTMGGGVISFLIMAFMVFLKDKRQWFLILGGISLVCSYVMEWFTPTIGLYHPWTVHLTLTLFIVFTLIGYPKLKLQFNH